MRRRHSVDVWPAVADLLLILMIVGFTTAAAQQGDSQAQAKATIDELKKQVEGAKAAAASAKNEVAELVGRLEEANKIANELQGIESLLADAQRANEKNSRACSAMQTAIRVHPTGSCEELRASMNEPSRVLSSSLAKSGAPTDPNIHINPQDLSISLDAPEKEVKFNGDYYPRNCIRTDGRDCRQNLSSTASSFATSVKEACAQADPNLFDLVVVGATDATPCLPNPDDALNQKFCNWKVSALRAAWVAHLIREQQWCPNFTRTIRAIGLADQEAVKSGDDKNSRTVKIQFMPRRTIEPNN